MPAGAGREWNWSGKREWPRGSEMFQPMLATVRKEFPADDEWGDAWVFEPKYDGIRIVALVTPGAIAMMSRNGIDKSREFPEISEALRELGKKLGRNVVIGPGFSNVDLALVKNTKIGERLNWQLRVDVFDLLNHANFTQPVSSAAFPLASNTTFGLITGGSRFPAGDSGSSRQLQLATKLIF